jgi:hypothetical protein
MAQNTAKRGTIKTLIAVIAMAVLIGACATAQLPKDSTFAQKAAAVCSDLDASVMLAQIGLTYAQNSNWAYDYSKAQITLTEASRLIAVTCSAAKTEGDLLAVRNAVLKALATAAQQQRDVRSWS